MRNAIKLVVVNLLVLLALWLGALFAFAVGSDLVDFAKSFNTKSFKRAELIAYDDHAHAQQVHRDQHERIKNYVPFIAWRQTEFASKTLNIDADGYRMHTVGTNNRADAVTAGFFGGSTVWGTGVDDDATISSRFDAITDGFRVTNYGERGFNTMQNLVELVTLINRDRAPKVVVFYEGFNDVWVHCNSAITDRLNSHMEERRIQAALDRTSGESLTYNMFVAPMVGMVRKIAGIKPAAGQAVCANDPKRADQVAETMVRDWQMAERLVSGYGGKFYVFLQPTAFSGAARLDYLKLKDSGAQRLVADNLRAVYPLVRAKLTALNAGWATDLSAALDGDKPLLLDDVHLSPAGNALIAEKIRAVVAPQDQAAAPAGPTQTH